MKKFVFAALLISLMFSGLALISLGNYGVAQSGNSESRAGLSDLQKVTPSHTINPNKPTDSPKQTKEPSPIETPKPSHTPNPNKPTPSETPPSNKPAEPPGQSENPTPNNTPNPNKPTEIPTPSETPKPTHSPNPNKPTPNPTINPEPSPTEKPTASPTPTATPAPTTAPGQQKYKISGYILDSNGNGLANAEIIFNVPSIVPSVYSDYTGYYAIYAPMGIYHIDVWPPFDSNFIFYDEPVYAVGSDAAKNITLLSGMKVSGYITDSSGTPVSGAVVSLNGFFCGWYSKYNGYYFVTAPPGTYTLNVRPRPGNSFPSFSEGNFTVNGNKAKNITLSGSGSNLSPTPTAIPTRSPASISILADTKFSEVDSTIFVTGKLSDQNGNPLKDKMVILSYAVEGSSIWYQVGSGKTSTVGEYSIQWVIAASGAFTLKVEWIGDNSFIAASDSTALSFSASKNGSG